MIAAMDMEYPSLIQTDHGMEWPAPPGVEVGIDEAVQPELLSVHHAPTQPKQGARLADPG